MSVLSRTPFGPRPSLIGTLLALAVVAAASCSSEGVDPTAASSPAPSPTASTKSPETHPEGTARTGTTPPPDSEETPDPESTSPPEESSEPRDFPTDPPPSEPVKTQNGGGSAATNLRSQPGCSSDDPPEEIAHLAWDPTDGDAQKVALTTRKDGFETGRYWTTETLPADRSSYTVEGVQPGGRYYWRVLTRHGESWAASTTADFTGPTCVSDQPG